MLATVTDIKTRRPLVRSIHEPSQPAIMVLHVHHRSPEVRPWPMLGLTLWLGPTICFGSVLLSVWMVATSVQMVRQWQLPIDLETVP